MCQFALWLYMLFAFVTEAQYNFKVECKVEFLYVKQW